MRNHAVLSSTRFDRMKAYLAAQSIVLEHDAEHRCYNLKKEKDESGIFWSLAYWQANQHFENVCALVTMSTGIMLPHTPRDSYRCPDCGCNTDAQVARGPIEGTTRCQECYDYSQGDIIDD
jgi:hypothetical protein